MTVEKISAVTLKVASMPTSVRFYRDLLGLEIIYGGEEASFSSLRTKHGKDPILNLEWGNPVVHWGRLIFYVSDVDRFWAYPEGTRTASAEAARRFMGRTLFPSIRSRWPRVVVCTFDLAVFQ